jgi:hypothetical protein
MSKQVSLGVVPFDAFYYKSCLHMPLMAAVCHFGGDLMPFLMNDVFVYGADKAARALGLTAYHHEARPEPDVLADMGIRSAPLASGTDLIEALLATIEERAVILVPVDRFSYRSNYNTLQGREHYPHHVLVCGFDCERETFEVIDAPETPIEGKNAFLTDVTFACIRSSHHDYLAFCDPLACAIRIFRTPNVGSSRPRNASDLLAATFLANRERMLSSLACLTAQAEALRTGDAELLASEPLEIVLRRLFPLDRAKEAEYQRITLALPDHVQSLGETMRRILILLKEYKLTLGSFLLRRTLSVANREALAAILDKVYGLEREFNLGLFAVLGQQRQSGIRPLAS